MDVSSILSKFKANKNPNEFVFPVTAYTEFLKTLKISKTLKIMVTSFQEIKTTTCSTKLSQIEKCCNG